MIKANWIKITSNLFVKKSV